MPAKSAPEVRFDFVSDDDLRESLESDYRELCACMRAKAWKAAHVLAGSIVEALLLDWLLANGVKQHKSKDVETLVLSDLVNACESNKLIAERPGHLSQVIRSYRNLIHPGRVLRLQEKADSRGATVARTLVEMLVDEISKTKAEKYGMTAEQLLHKLVGDPQSIAYIAHLLKDVKEAEKSKLLLQLIPDRDAEFISQSRTSEGGKLGALVRYADVRYALRECFRIVFDGSDEKTKRAAVANYVKILREDTSYNRAWYEETFFMAADLAYCEENERRMVLDHLFSRIDDFATPPARMYTGIHEYLTMENWSAFFASAYANRSDEEWRTLMSRTIQLMPNEIRVKVLVWKRAEDRKVEEAAAADDIPF